MGHVVRARCQMELWAWSEKVCKMSCLVHAETAVFSAVWGAHKDKGLSKGRMRRSAGLRMTERRRQCDRGRLTKRAFWRHVTTSSGSPWGVGDVAGGCAWAMAASGERVWLACAEVMRCWSAGW
jgi:hypothetical protein